MATKLLSSFIGRWALLSSVAVTLWATSPVHAGQAYVSPITINSSQVPSTQTDFPILISVTDNRFKTIGNGGHVNNSNGYDIRPYSDSGAATAITGYELERYNASTGEVIMWVKRSSVSDGLVTYLGYGDTSLTTDGSSTTTWSNSFTSVHHLKDGTTLTLTDSSGNSRNGTNINAATAATGQIDGGVGLLSASNQYINVGSYYPGTGTALTISGWVKATSFPNSYNTMMSFVGSGKAAELLVKSTGKLTCFVSATTDRSYDGTGSHTLSTGAFYLLHMTYDSTNGLIGYVNAASDGTATANGNANTSPNNGAIGEDTQTTGRRWNGTIDEVRTSSVARSQDWITTEYNNQSAPGTFETLGTEVALTSNPGWFFFFP